MQLYKVTTDNAMKLIKESKPNKEKYIQTITENNLKTIFGLEFICSEFIVGNLRIDTLAYNPETRSFVIIEYKVSQSSGVIDQGFAYLGMMLERKADFVQKITEQKNKVFRVSDIIWDQSRVYFVSTSFNQHQKGILGFNDLPLSLCEIRTFEGGHISFNRLEYGGHGSSYKLSGITNPFIKKVSSQVNVWIEDDHLAKTSEEIRSLYDTLKNRLHELGIATIEPKAKYLAFKSRTNVVDIIVQKNRLKLILNVRKGTLVDNMHISRDVSSKGHWGNGDYEIMLYNDDNMLYVLSLIEQSLRANQ